MSLFTRHQSQRHFSDPLVAVHPQISLSRSMRMFFLFPIGLFLFIGVVMPLIDKIASGTARFPWQLLSITPLYLGIIGFSFVAERWWKPVEALRQAAAGEDRRFLAREQPRPNAEALAVPVKIITRYSQKRLRTFGPIFAFLVIGFGDAVFFFEEWLQRQVDASLWPWLLSLTAIVSAVMIFVIVVSWRQRWVVEIGPEGMRSWVQSMGTRDTGLFLLWHEARLFACYRNPGPWNKGSVLTYELSSARQVVTWTWVQRQEPLRVIEEPILPFEEHQEQMRALCSLITAKTGLPLYDLSSEQALERESFAR